MRVRGGDPPACSTGRSSPPPCARRLGRARAAGPRCRRRPDLAARTAAYPLGDLMVLGVAIGLLSTPGARTPSFVLLIGSIVTLFVADTAYASRSPRARTSTAASSTACGCPRTSRWPRRALHGRCARWSRRTPSPSPGSADPAVPARPGDAHRAGARADRRRPVEHRRRAARDRLRHAVAARAVAARVGRAGARPRQRGPGQARGRAQLPRRARPAHRPPQPAPVRRAARGALGR